MKKTSCLIYLMIAGFVAIVGCSEAGSGIDSDGVLTRRGFRSL